VLHTSNDSVASCRKMAKANKKMMDKTHLQQTTNL